LSDLFVAFTQSLAVNYDRVGFCAALIARDKHFIIQQNWIIIMRVIGSKWVRPSITLIIVRS